MKKAVLDLVANPLLNPTGYLIKKLADDVSSLSKDPTNQAELDKLNLIAQKQQLEMQVAESQAKVAQELAIARRIEIAEEVEIEEFYDLNGSACLGVNTQTGNDISIGAKATGQKVSKRIYKFKGVNASLNHTDEINSNPQP